MNLIQQTKENAVINYSYKLTADLKKGVSNDWLIQECSNVLAIAIGLDVQTSTEGLANALDERIDAETEKRLLAVQLEETF